MPALSALPATTRAPRSMPPLRMQRRQNADIIRQYRNPQGGHR